MNQGKHKNLWLELTVIVALVKAAVPVQLHIGHLKMSAVYILLKIFRIVGYGDRCIGSCIGAAGIFCYDCFVSERRQFYECNYAAGRTDCENVCRLHTA